MPGISLTARAGRIWGAYERQLARRPILTQMTTSALLWSVGDVCAQKVGESRRGLDTRRIGLTAGFGAGFMGPVGHYWYQGLEVVCRALASPGSPMFIAAKLTADTFIMGPLYVIAFYAYGCAVIDGGGWDAFKVKVQKDFLPTFAAELAIWPLFQTFNFTRIPVKHQLLAVNCMTLIDATFLSWARSQEDWVGTLQATLQELKTRQGLTV